MKRKNKYPNAVEALFRDLFMVLISSSACGPLKSISFALAQALQKYATRWGNLEWTGLTPGCVSIPKNEMCPGVKAILVCPPKSMRDLKV
ncbi:hypothetical protein JOH50_001724 [Rhizobium leguminosarum]|nr:hypothetical protein [Rhizobium leguminosarum]